MKLCDCKCQNCINKDHKHCEYECDEVLRIEQNDEILEDGYITYGQHYEDESN